MNVGKVLWKLTWVAVQVILSAASGSSSRSRTKTYTHGEAYGLLHNDQITITEFVDSISD